jgi:hypothetical protein
MKGDKITFIDGKTFYKQYTKNEFLYLKMLHGSTNLEISITADKKYITMPAGNVISIDTIPKNKRNNAGIKSIIIKNIPFMLEQINLLNNLGIYYSDCMQWLLYNNRLYLIDLDAAYMTKIDYNYNNHDLLINFLNLFNIDTSMITESRYYLTLFQTEDIEWTFYNDAEKELYNRLNIPDMPKNHIYISRNQRHIQININNIHVYGNSGNMVITENILNPELCREWELLKVV